MMKKRARRLIRTVSGISLSVALLVGMVAPKEAGAAIIYNEPDITSVAMSDEYEQEAGDVTHAKGIIYSCEQCDMYDMPEGSVIAELLSGQQVSILARLQRQDGSAWYKISTHIAGISYTGYIASEYLLCIDYDKIDEIEIIIEDTETVDAEDEAGEASEDASEDASVDVENETEEASEDTSDEAEAVKDSETESDTEVTDNDGIVEAIREEMYQELTSLQAASFEESIAAFPASYKTYLRDLHADHPNWIFVMQTTNINWNTFIENEMVKARNLVERSMPDAYKGKQSWAYDPTTGEYIGLSGDNWVQASEAAVKYFADPRNFLVEEDVFQFELLTYNSSYQTKEGVNLILNGTFMEGSKNMVEDITYADAFMKIGAEQNVSPYMLAARVRQEQGAHAGASHSELSPLITGTYSGYEGYYNYFNIKAAGETKEEIYINGLTYAKEQGWNTRYKSLSGGAGVLSANYISHGQDTLYLQKFDVDDSYDGLFWHQYMQNVRGAYNEGKTAYNTYSGMGILNNTFVFKIPVYVNMPSTACVKPDASVNVAEVEAFVKRIYTELMGRTPEENGLAYWTKSIVDQKVTAATAILFFAESDELKKKNLSDKEYIERLYRTMMNREADASGLSYWLGMLNSGLSRRYILSSFVSSREFRNICKAYGVTKGDITLLEDRDKYPGATRYVYRLYDKALGRKADVGGLNYWSAQIGTGKKTPYDVAAFVILSDEFKGHNYSDEEYMKILYVTFMNRGADSSGLKYWKSELAKGVSRETVLKKFLGTAEFKKIVEDYGI